MVSAAIGIDPYVQNPPQPSNTPSIPNLGGIGLFVPPPQGGGNRGQGSGFKFPSLSLNTLYKSTAKPTPPPQQQSDQQKKIAQFLAGLDPTAGDIKTPADFSKVILEGLGAPVTKQNLDSLDAWQRSEGGMWGGSPDVYNPLNTTQNEPGAVSTNDPGVKAYTNWDQGVKATLTALTNGLYNPIIQDLKSNNQSQFQQDVLSSPWGTHNLDVSNPTYNTSPPPGTDPHFDGLRAIAAQTLAYNAGNSNTGHAVSYAMGQLGVPYLWGGTSPGGWDCSGLVQASFAQAGIQLPRTSEAQYAALKQAGDTFTDVSQAQPGDLVFFNPGEDGEVGLPGHVGIYLGNNMMINAPYTGANVDIVRVDSATQGGTPMAFGRPSGSAGGVPSYMGGPTAYTGAVATGTGGMAGGGKTTNLPPQPTKMAPELLSQLTHNSLLNSVSNIVSQAQPTPSNNIVQSLIQSPDDSVIANLLQGGTGDENNPLTG